ncbi:hypothetical protein Chor_016639 [Crotalus horridus]
MSVPQSLQDNTEKIAQKRKSMKISLGNYHKWLHLKMLRLAYMQLPQAMRSKCAESFRKTRLEERFKGRREMVKDEQPIELLILLSYNFHHSSLLFMLMGTVGNDTNVVRYIQLTEMKLSRCSQREKETL